MARLDPEQREAALARMREETFDVLVIGGGATGTGCALDAASRGLSVTLLRPRAVAGGGAAGGRGLAKWSGYVDKFVLFIPALRRALRC